MGSASNYWRLVRLDGTGYRKVEDVAIAKTFFYHQFAELTGQPDVPNIAIQRTLLQLMQSERASLRSSDQSAAEYCLRCFISQQIEQVCVQLEVKFGARHGFSRYDLFPFVLGDEGHWRARRRGSTQYQSLASEILQTFDPSRAGLSTWVMRQVRHHRELRAFLHEHGVYLATDWGILNDTSPEQLRSVLAEFYGLTSAEIEPACAVLRGYHQIYRRDRLQKRQLGLLRGKEVCLPPTPDQLMRIAQYLQEQDVPLQSVLPQSSDSIVSNLQLIATKLRQYRLHKLGKPLMAESLDRPEMQAASC